uniref:Variant-specific antigen n=1 Tax=Trypanosoma brucei TaxID=5691 RepID=Q26726_9TRYP|nr:variant-specific antigen [Trypanosoma brucei brucei]
MMSVREMRELRMIRPIRTTITQCVSGDYLYHNTGDFDVLCKIYRITQAELPQPSFKNREKEGEIMSKLEEMVREVEAAGGTQDLSHSSNSTTAYQEIKKLFEKAKKMKEEIEVNRTKALNASRSAKDNMLRAVYGDVWMIDLIVLVKMQ